MIGTAKESIVLSTFDLRADENGTKLLAALNHAAAKGVKIQLLIDGIYQQLFLAGSSDFQALAAHENVEVGVYNPVTPANLFKLNYRMHDKYVIIDEKMYLLGGRNSNDIFLGDHTEDINVDRDILVYDTSEGQGESLQQLENYFHEIWNESCVHVKKGKESSRGMGTKNQTLPPAQQRGAGRVSLKSLFLKVKGQRMVYSRIHPAKPHSSIINTALKR